MTTQTPTPMMTERDAFLSALEREYETTARLFRDYPKDKLDLKPNDRLQSARDVMWMQVIDRGVMQVVATSDLLEPHAPPAAPPTLDALLGALAAAQTELVTKVKAMDPAAMNGMVTMPVGPKQTGKVRRGDAMWMFLYDGIHHRGQSSVYQRLAGGRVGSIYGPSGDEPWW